MPSISVSKIKSYYKEYGILGLAKKALRRIFLAFFAYYPLNFYVISGAPKTNLETRCPLEIRKGNWEDIGVIVGMLENRNMDESAVRKREKYLIDNGGELFLAFSEGKLAHIAWLFHSPGIRETLHTITIQPNEAYISSCYTHPAFRGKNIYPVVLQHVFRYATAYGIKRCFISAGSKNSGSIKGIEKAGYSFIGKLRVFRLFGKLFNNHWISSKRI